MADPVTPRHDCGCSDDREVQHSNLEDIDIEAISELQIFVKKLLPTIEGLESIVVSDRDGVTLVEARSGSVPSATVKPPFLGIFSIASEQASKLGLGKNKGIISYYSGHQVVQFNYFPLVLTFIAHTDANTGMIYSLEEEMHEAVGDLQSTVSVP